MEKPKAPFEEEFFGLMYDLFRSAGVPINTVNQEKVHKLMPRVAQSLRREAHRASLDLVKRLQGATKDGFTAFEKEIDKLKPGILLAKAHDREVKELREEIGELRKKVDELAKRPQDLTFKDSG